MNNTERNVLIIAVVVVLAAAATAWIVTSNDNVPEEPVASTYTIEYVLNGGTNNEQNPSTYVSGTAMDLIPPTKEGYAFSGWYLDEGLTEYFEGITEKTKGDLVLYAAWSDNLEGHGFTLEIDGTVKNGFMDRYNIKGEASYRYLYYDETNGRYYMNLTQNLDYIYTFSTYSSSKDKNYWSDESSQTYTEEYLGTEEIDTVYGKKTCDVYRLTYADGSTETQWIGDGWIPFYIEYVQEGLLSSTKITYTFTEEIHFVPDVDCDVIAYADDGITVSGEGTFKPGDEVTLTATGSGFSGWYDGSGTMVSTSKTYTFTIGGSDVTLYAMNDKDPDIVAEKGSVTTVSAGYELDSAYWTVMDLTGESLMTTDTTTLKFTADAAGEYVILLDGVVGDTPVHQLWNLSVEGDTALTYTWEYNGKTYTTTLTIDYADYKYYRDLTPVSERCQESTHIRDKQFVTYEDKYIAILAKEFKSMTSGMTDVQIANFILAFTQYIEYQSDEVFTGYEEYWKYPVETLYDQGGDCEDTSILFSAIAEAMGYNTSLLVFPGHMAAGIDLDNASGVYFSTGGYKFYYCETTSTGFSVGDKPSNVSNSATVVKICSNTS